MLLDIPEEFKQTAVKCSKLHIPTNDFKISCVYTLRDELSEDDCKSLTQKKYLHIDCAAFRKTENDGFEKYIKGVRKEVQCDGLEHEGRKGSGEFELHLDDVEPTHIGFYIENSMGKRELQELNYTIESVTIDVLSLNGESMSNGSGFTFFPKKAEKELNIFNTALLAFIVKDESHPGEWDFYCNGPETEQWIGFREGTRTAVFRTAAGLDYFFDIKVVSVKLKEPVHYSGSVEVHEMKNLPAMDILTSDPYFEVEGPCFSDVSPIKKNTLNPKFKYKLPLAHVLSSSEEGFLFKVFDHDKIGSNEKIGDFFLDGKTILKNVDSKEFSIGPKKLEKGNKDKCKIIFEDLKIEPTDWHCKVQVGKTATNSTKTVQGMTDFYFDEHVVHLGKPKIFEDFLTVKFSLVYDESSFQSVQVTSFDFDCKDIKVKHNNKGKQKKIFEDAQGTELILEYEISSFGFM